MSRFANLMERLNEPLPDSDAVSRSNVSQRLAAMRAGADDQSQRLPAFRTPKPAAHVAPVASVPAAPAISKAMLIAEATERGRSEARARYANVMRSSAAVGREKQAKELLLASCDHNAQFQTSEAIIAELGRRATDAEADKAINMGRKASAEAVWDRVNAKQYERLRATNPLSRIENKPATPSASPTAQEAVWDRAWAKVSAGRGRPLPAAAPTQPAADADSVWDRAWAKLGRVNA